MKKKEKKPSIVQRFYSDDFKISAKGKWYVIAPACIILAGLIVFAVINFNLGVDLTGGRIIRVRTDEASYETHRAALVEIFDEVHQGTFEVRQRNDEGRLSIEIQYQNLRMRGASQEEIEVAMDRLTADLRTTIMERLEIGAGRVTALPHTSARASTEHLTTTFIAVVIALIVIMLYMLIRFKFNSGVAALVALAHDIIVMLALTAITRVQINFAFIAAIITVLAYSLNNTIIVFDRVRSIEKTNENRLTTEQIVDKAVKETFVRTMNTMITTLVPIFVLIVFGVQPIREFALPILFGLLAGNFSTIFIATSLYVRFENASIIWRKRKKLAKV
jgi:preprotein translocase subunit SecF